MATKQNKQGKQNENQNQNPKTQKGKQQQPQRTGLQGKLGTKQRDM